MSVLPMKRVLIVGMRPDRKKMLEFLQRRGVLEITTHTESEGEEADPVFYRLDVSGQQTTFEKNSSLAKQALATLDAACPGKHDDGGMFSGRKRMSLTDYETNTAKCDKTMNTVYEINALAKRLTEIQSDIPKYETQLEALRPWAGFQEALDFNGTAKTKAFVGTLPNEQTEQMILEQLSSQGADTSGIDLTIISASQEQTCVMFVSLSEEADKVEEALRHMSFARPSVSGGIPAQMETESVEKLRSLRAEMDETREKIAAYKDEREAIKFAIDYYAMRADKYGILGGIEQTDKVFVIEGYTPVKEADQLSELLTSRFDCVVEFGEVSPDDETVPVALKNNWFGAPVEGVVSSYSLPGVREIDPSFIVAIFYYFLFGMMLSDAAYGLIMIIACAVILKKGKNMEPGMRKTMTMFMYCGIGTLFWGIMFGSWFGDLPLVIVQTFINPEADFSLALWVEPAVGNGPMAVLGFSFIVGIIHILFGMAASAYMSIKNGKWFDAVCDVFFWYLLLIGGIGIMLGTDMIQGMFNFTLTIPPAVNTLLLVMVLIGAVGITLFTGRDSKNWGIRIGRGLYGLYGITSYLSDVLSYSRLLALGLATGVISSVFNSMAAMLGTTPVVGIFLFILICVVGHSLNLGINALGAYVHTNRLQYVEFFGKFYNGGGRAFTPFEEHTKYFKVTE